MRIEVNDEAARLRQQQTPIQCGAVAGFALPPKMKADGTNKKLATCECDDCGDCQISCRCKPGEG